MANTYNEAGYTYNDLLSRYNTLAATATAWPTVPLAVRVDLQLGGAWTNVTSDVYTAEQIHISRGRSDEAAAAQASAATFVLNNRTGKYTPKNPTGPYYGQLNRATPVRIGIGVPPAGTASGNNPASTSLVAPSVVAESAGMVFSAWAQQSNTATVTVPGGYTSPGQMSGASPTGLTSNSGFKSIGAPGTVPVATATSTVSGLWSAISVFIPGVTAATAAGNANGVYSFTANAFGPNATVGAVSASAGNVLVALVSWSTDSRNAMVTAPIDNSQSAEWTLVADSGPSAGPRCQAWARYCPVAESLIVQAPGECYGGNDTQLALFQCTAGAASWNPRYTGVTADLSTTADLSGNDVRTTVTAGQILRQRGQGQQAAESAFYRYLTDKLPRAYWPLETGTLGGAFNSPIAGCGPAVPFAVNSGADSVSFPASDSLPTTAVNGSIQFPVPTYTAGTNSSGSVFFLLNVPTAPTINAALFAIRFSGAATSGVASTVYVQYINTTQLNLAMIDGTGAVTPILSGLNVPTVAGAQSGGSIIGTPMGFFLGWNPNVANPTTQTDFLITPCTLNGVVGKGNNFATLFQTLGRVTSMSAGIDQFADVAIGTVMTVGHVMFDEQVSNIGSTSGAIPNTRVFPNTNCQNIVSGFNNEPVSLRLRRICQDESIFLSSPILASESTDTSNIRHGPQPIANGLDLITLTQATDGGELAEARGFNGLLYRPLGSMGSRPIVQTFDYNAKMIGEPFAPADDDQLVRNDITVSQNNGSSARAFAATGTLSVNPPPSGVGTYTSSLTVDVAQQGRDLQQIANWNLALGTYDAERFKQVRSMLEAAPTQATVSSLVDIGNHVQITNTPNWVQTGPSDVIVIGLQELIGTIPEWEITVTGRPYGPFNVLRADGGNAFARLDSGTSTLNASATSAQTTLLVASQIPDNWSATAVPYDIVVSGERMTVTAATAPGSVLQTLTVTRSVNGVVKAHGSGEAVHVFYATYLGLNGGS